MQLRQSTLKALGNLLSCPECLQKDCIFTSSSRALQSNSTAFIFLEEDARDSFVIT